MRIKHQLFLTLLVANAILIALMYVISTTLFSRGFVAYINESEQRRLEPMIEQLAARYETHGDWQWLQEDRRIWTTMIARVLLDEQRPMPGPRRERREPPPEAGESQPRPRKRRESPGQPPRKPHRDASDSLIDPRLVLENVDRQRVMGGRGGDDRSQIHWSEIKVGDETVGYLGFRTRQRLTREFNQRFEKQQRRSLAIAAVAMALLSALLSIPLAGYLVRPILSIRQVVGKMANGDYQQKISVTRNDEIGELSSSINHLGHALEKNLQARQQWIAEISHELRTPVAVLKGEIEAIRDGVRVADDEAIGSLQEEVQRINHLIDDLHDLSLADVGALNYQMEPVAINTLIADRLAASRRLASEKSLTVNFTPVEPDLMVLGDSQRLGQLFDNLFANSVNYTDEGGQIRVTAMAERAGGESARRVTIIWRDSAPKPQSNDYDKLFDPLYRDEASRNRVTGGSGLGLAIARKIVTAHQGEISASESDLGGLSIRISLPLE